MLKKIKKIILNNLILSKIQSYIVIVLRRIPGIEYISGVINFKKVRIAYDQINREFKKENLLNGSISIEESIINEFKKGFKKYILAQPKRYELPKLFIEADIRLKKESFKKSSVGEKDILLICVVKNDLYRMKVFMEHYRKIGISNFIIIDNLSDDGTFEFLNEQKDVNLYSCKTPYSTLNRESWINRIIAHYGFNHWYLCVDSDELFVYSNMENVPIDNFIENERSKRIRSIMIDMYSENGIWENSDLNSIDIKKKYCYFDTNSYKERANLKFELIVGGPRTRVFSKTENDFSGIMVKHPLFFFERGDIQGHSHYQFPFKYNFGLKNNSALLHYKFLPSDLHKYKQRVELKNYANGSSEYNIYIQSYNEDPSLSFMYGGSEKYKNSLSLNLINIYNKNNSNINDE
ncbi:glycosyltransferase family 2 protein [Clostridium sp.]|uniref:glycosyltransferase family 2 protein n=1 Tax=Clostridium sp. TaxID=1506 RepID=UPI0025C3111A|nr:glycosyltransferase family 2 protein [Clostridium sp.]